MKIVYNNILYIKQDVKSKSFAFPLWCAAGLHMFWLSPLPVQAALAGEHAKIEELTAKIQSQEQPAEYLLMV